MSKVPLSILLVEDEADIRAVMAVALGRDPSVRLSMFADAPEVIAHLNQSDHAAYEVALINVHLPTISGIRLAEQLWQREDCSGLPVIFVTAAVTAQDYRQYTDIGAIGVLSKPFDPLALSDQVRALLAAARIQKSQAR